MANIALQNLADINISGISLFNDSEDFMRDLVDDEINISGGKEDSSPFIFFPDLAPVMMTIAILNPYPIISIGISSTVL
jgi:hypothetical protein